MRILIIIIVLAVMPSVLWGQLAREAVEADIQYGWIIAHNEELTELAKSRPYGLNIRYQWMRKDRKNWEACNCFHYLGVGLVIQDFGRAEELGNAISLYGNFEPVLLRSERLELSLGMGVGATYLSRVYEEETNPQNTFFSSHLSFLLFVNPELMYRLTPAWELSAALTYNHISNGGQKKPNRGMNYPMAGFGVRYLLRNDELPDYRTDQFKGSWAFYVDAGVNRRDAPTGGHAANFNLNIGAYRKVLPVIGLGGGVELSYDFSVQNNEGEEGSFIPAVFIANHFLFGRFDFSQHFALYLNKPEDYMTDRSFYQRYTLHYMVSDRIRIGAGLKAHGHVAEYLDLRLGLILGNDRTK